MPLAVLTDDAVLVDALHRHVNERQIRAVRLQDTERDVAARSPATHLDDVERLPALRGEVNRFGGKAPVLSVVQHGEVRIPGRVARPVALLRRDRERNPRRHDLTLWDYARGLLEVAPVPVRWHRVSSFNSR